MTPAEYHARRRSHLAALVRSNRVAVTRRVWRELESLRMQAVAGGMSDEDARRWAIGVCEAQRRFTMPRSGGKGRYKSARQRALRVKGRAA